VQSDTTLTCTMSNVLAQFPSGTATSATNVMIVTDTAQIGPLSITVYASSSVHIDSVAPTHGTTLSDTLVTFTGTGFFSTADATCIVTDTAGTVTRLPATIASATALTCTLPHVAISEVSQLSQTVSVVPSLTAQTIDAVPIFQPQNFTYRMPAPALTSAVLSAGGASISLDWTFDLTPLPSACSSIFTPSTMALLGATTTCAWLSPSSLIVTLGLDANIILSSTIALLDGVFSRKDASFAYQITGLSTALTTAEPIASYTPVVSISGSTQGALCALDNVVLASSVLAGSAYKPDVLVWSVTVRNAANEDITSPSGTVETFVALQSSSKTITLGSSSFIQDQQYVFTLTVTNGLGVSTTAIHAYRAVSAQAPQVVITSGSAVQAQRSLPTLIDFSVTFSNCLTGAPPSTQTAWSVTSLDGAPAVTVQAPLPGARQLTIPANTLTAGKRYSIQVSVGVVGSASAPSTASTTVSVTSLGLLPRIVGGDRSFFDGETVTLDASSSVDLDTDSSSGLTYAWACTSYALVYKSTAIPCDGILSSPSAPSVTATLAASAAHYFLFSLTVTKSSGASESTVTMLVFSPASSASVNALMTPLGSTAPVLVGITNTLRALVTASASITGLRWEVATVAGIMLLHGSLCFSS
jgi:hypothetical protein